MATQTISLQPNPTNRDSSEFSGRRRTITLVVGVIVAVFLLFLLFLGEYLLRRDRRQRLLANADHELPQPPDIDSEVRPMPPTVRQASALSDNTVVDAPGTSSSLHRRYVEYEFRTVPGSAATQYPQVYNQRTPGNVQARI